MDEANTKIPSNTLGALEGHQQGKRPSIEMSFLTAPNPNKNSQPEDSNLKLHSLSIPQQMVPKSNPPDAQKKIAKDLSSEDSSEDSQLDTLRTEDLEN